MKYFIQKLCGNSWTCRQQMSSSMKGQGVSFVSSKSHVRLCIKSFRVPELFIEIPETANVGSLKRMVMEAVSTLLSDGHRVGLMFTGKKSETIAKPFIRLESLRITPT